MTLKVSSVFAVPLGAVMHPHSANLNAELRRVFLEREACGDQYKNMNPSLAQQPGVFESEFEIFSWPIQSVQALKHFCWSALGEMVTSVNGYSLTDTVNLRIYSHTWFHVTRKGGFVIPHSHPMASWSGVYCVDDGLNEKDIPNSGLLRFHNPHAYSNTFMDPGNAAMKPPFHHGFWNQRLIPGQLVLFPSWLIHDVTPFEGEGTRITVAFNCWFGHD